MSKSGGSSEASARERIIVKQSLEKIIRSYRYDDRKSRADVHGYALTLGNEKKEQRRMKSRKRCAGLGTGVKENVRRAEGEAPLLERRKKPRYFRPPGAATL